MIGVPDEVWGEAVKAIVVRVPTVETLDDILAPDIIEHCRIHLAHYKCPKSVDFAATLPRNPSGKILKRELRGPYWQDGDRSIH